MNLLSCHSVRQSQGYLIGIVVPQDKFRSLVPVFSKFFQSLHQRDFERLKAAYSEMAKDESSVEK